MHFTCNGLGAFMAPGATSTEKKTTQDLGAGVGVRFFPVDALQLGNPKILLALSHLTIITIQTGCLAFLSQVTSLGTKQQKMLLVKVERCLH